MPVVRKISLVLSKFEIYHSNTLLFLDYWRSEDQSTSIAKSISAHCRYVVRCKHNSMRCCYFVVVFSLQLLFHK